jgi:hypothetical protein
MDDNIREIFSNNLKKFLKEQKKTQLELANFVGISDAAVNNWVKGYKLPRMDKVDKICKFFSIKRSDLLESTTPQSINDIDFTGIERIAAEHKGENFTQEELKFIQDTIDFVVAKKRKLNKKDRQPND